MDSHQHTPPDHPQPKVNQKYSTHLISREIHQEKKNPKNSPKNQTSFSTPYLSKEAAFPPPGSTHVQPQPGYVELHGCNQPPLPPTLTNSSSPLAAQLKRVQLGSPPNTCRGATPMGSSAGQEAPRGSSSCSKLWDGTPLDLWRQHLL